MERSPTWLAVVALALGDESGRLLLQQRPLHKHHGGLWEFPGGKVEYGETPREALCREIAEELGIAIEPASLSPALVADEGKAGRVVLILYTCSKWDGEVSANDGQQWGWFDRQAAKDLPMAPMDSDFLTRLGD